MNTPSYLWYLPPELYNAAREALCNTCCRPAHSPYRVYDERGNVIQGCIDDCHTGHLVTPSASASWHNRKEAKQHRAKVAAHLRSL